MYPNSKWKLGRIKDTEGFVDKSIWVWLGEKWDYSKVEYLGSQTKICIVCEKHGDFWMLPHVHLRGSGCRECAISKSKSNLDSFIKKSKSVHNNKYNYRKSKYVNSKEKIEVICPSHGEFWIIPNDHLRGHGCRKCAWEYSAKIRTSDTQRFIEKSIEKHGYKYDYSRVAYVTNRDKVAILCNEHGEFWIKPNSHLSGKGCKECYIQSRRSSTEEFIKSSVKLHGDKYDYSNTVYRGSSEKLEICCPKHGEFYIVASSHSSLGKGCPGCWNERNSWRLNDAQMAMDYITYLIKITKMSDKNLSFYKIGITCKTLDTRFSSLKGDGFYYAVIAIYESCGEECQNLEDALIKHLKEQDCYRKCYHLKGTMTKGWTECFECDKVAESVKNLINNSGTKEAVHD